MGMGCTRTDELEARIHFNYSVETLLVGFNVPILPLSLCALLCERICGTVTVDVSPLSTHLGHLYHIIRPCHLLIRLAHYAADRNV